MGLALTVSGALNLGVFAVEKLPTCVTTTRQRIEDPDGAMLNFYAALRKADAGLARVRVLHYGDSHVAADLLTGQLRNQLQQRFGDGGIGFVLAGKPWAWYRRGNLRSRQSNGWKVEGLGKAAQSAGGQFGLAGVSLTTAGKDEWITLQANGSRFDLYLLKQPGGGVIDVRLDDEPIDPQISLAAKTFAPFYLSVEAESEGLHTLEIRTVKPGAVKIFGVAIENHQAGVVYDALGINGARLYRPLAWDWHILASNLEHRSPNLIVIAYGSNEVSDPDLDLNEYGKKFSLLLNRLHQAAPAAALLVMAPPDRATFIQGTWQSLARMSALVATQRAAALKSGAAFWNLFQAMGGAGAIEGWHQLSLAQADRVHLTRRGYQKVAELLYAELLRGYLATPHREKKSQAKGKEER